MTYKMLEKAVDNIEQVLMSGYEREVGSGRIGELAMEELKQIDEVAYVRFASVYKEFDDVQNVYTNMKPAED